jgi:uncharacterized protein YbaR (Trm112 family)
LLSADLVKVMRCPWCLHRSGKKEDAELGRLDIQGDLLVCRTCGLRYPVERGFPVMIEDEALPPTDGEDPRGAQQPSDRQ